MAPTDDNHPLTTAPEAVQPTVGNQREDNETTSKETFSPSVFVNSEPIREDQVENAVKFLSHPKVKGSAVIHRRSFLEKKGLTEEEIDEAFRRVPDSAPTISAIHPATTTQDGQMKPQPLVTGQNLQSPAAVAGVNPNQGVLLRYHFHWWHALAVLVSGAGAAVIFKRSIVPRLKSWIRKVVLEEEESAQSSRGNPSLQEAVAAAAKAAAAAAADVARASQEMLTTKREERIYNTELIRLLEMQIREMNSMRNSVHKLEARSSAPPSNAVSHPKSYTEEINNNMLPNPDQPLLRPKPWEVQTQSNSTIQYNYGKNGPANRETPIPRWQNKNIKITELENEDEFKTPSADVLVAQPFRPSWLPPQPPSVTMPEAAAAIRQSHRPLSRMSSDDQSSAADELPRGVIDANELNSDMSKEIQEDREAY